MTYLRPKQVYVDLYDHMAVDDCRWRENFHKNYKSEKDTTELQIDIRKMTTDVALYYDIFFTTLYWWEHKSEKIQKWMDDDERKDKLLETATPPSDIRCLKCWTPLTMRHKSLHDWSERKDDRVIFFYDCPCGCLPHRAFFDDGEEYRMKRELCPKCQVDLVRTCKRLDKKRIDNIDTCPQCGYVNTFIFEVGTHEEKPDPDFEKDRARFCLTDVEGREAMESRAQMDQLGKLADKWKEEKEHKADYDAVAKINKLNVLDLEKLLAPVFEKAGFLRLQLGTPEISKDFLLPFTAYDSKSERTDRASTHDLAKIIKKSLADTNWRLMSDGISYRLGFLSGRLHAYEQEEDLLKLVRQNNTKNIE